MSLESLNDLYVEQLRDLYSAETQLVEALPIMAEAANAKELQRAFNNHLEQTRQHVERLEVIFKLLNTTPQGEKCKGMEGLIKEGSKMAQEEGDKATLDAGLIATAQRVEHYEIAGYGTVCTFAKMLGHDDVLNLLKQTLNDEKTADQTLNELAEYQINPQAMRGQAKIH